MNFKKKKSLTFFKSCSHGRSAWDAPKKSSRASEDPSCPAHRQGATCVEQKRGCAAHSRMGRELGHPHLVGTRPGRKRPPAALLKSLEGLETTSALLHTHMHNPPTPAAFKRESRRRGRASSCKHQSPPPPLPPCSLHLQHQSPAPCQRRTVTSGELAEAEGRGKTLACAGRHRLQLLPEASGGVEGGEAWDRAARLRSFLAHADPRATFPCGRLRDQTHLLVLLRLQTKPGFGFRAEPASRGGTHGSHPPHPPLPALSFPGKSLSLSFLR